MEPDCLPTIKQSVEVFPTAKGAIRFFAAASDDDFLMENPGRAERLALEMCDGKHAVATIVDACLEVGTSRHDAMTFLDELAAAGLLFDARPGVSPLTARHSARYDRQLAYFTDRLPYGHHAADAQRALMNATVVILGLGGVGSRIALEMAAIGVGALRLVDGDVVESSNLNRQTLYRTRDLGRAKAAVATEAILRLNPDSRVQPVPEYLECEDAVSQAIVGADWVVEAIDTPVGIASHWVNRACLTQGIPHTAMSQFPPTIRVGPTFIPGVTGCYRCYEQPAREALGEDFESLMAYRTSRGAIAAATGPGCGWIASMIAMDILHTLTGLGEPATRGRAFTIDTRSFTSSVEDVHRWPSCPDCARQATRPRAPVSR